MKQTAVLAFLYLIQKAFNLPDYPVTYPVEPEAAYTQQILNFTSFLKEQVLPA